MVVLPDYQGLGIGHAFSTEIARHYKNKGFRVVITSSTKALFLSRSKSKDWAVTRKGRTSKGRTDVGKNTAHNKITYSYEFIGNG